MNLPCFLLKFNFLYPRWRTGTKTPEKSSINLKQLPPLAPENVTNISTKIKPSLVEGRNPVEDDERTKASEVQNLKNEDASFGSGECKQIPTTRRKTTKKKTASNKEGSEESQGRAKSELYEIRAANKWKPPLFERCMDDGPSHMKMSHLR